MLTHQRPTGFTSWMRSVDTRLRRLDSRIARVGSAAVVGYTAAEWGAMTPAAGTVVFDTTNGRLVLYNGAAWVNADGTAL